jgi:hypothetical protein
MTVILQLLRRRELVNGKRCVQKKEKLKGSIGCVNEGLERRGEICSRGGNFITSAKGEGCQDYFVSEICMGSMIQSRIPDSTEGRDAAAHHSINDLLRQLLIRNDADSFGVEILDESIGELNHVRLPVSACICINPSVYLGKNVTLMRRTIDNSVGTLLKDRIHKLIAERLTYIGRRPQ